jgi:hypothetical protein
MIPGFVFLIAGAVICALVAQYFYRQARRDELARVAKALGLTYARDDDRNTTSLPFALFRKGDGNGSENLMSGQLEGRPVRLVEYWYYEESSDSKGSHSRSYHRFSCAIGLLAFDGPSLSIGHETLLSRVGQHLGLADIELESEEFNRAFRLHADDKKFAYAVCDGTMMAWLLATGRPYCFETIGPFVMAYTHRLRPRELPDLARALLGFGHHIPTVVASLYPAAPNEMKL